MPLGADKEIKKSIWPRLWMVLLHLVVLSCLASCQDEDQKFDDRLAGCVSQKAVSDGTVCLENLLKAYPDRLSIHSFLADNYRELRELEKAEAAIQIFIRAYPYEAEGHLRYCRILEDKNEISSALVECLQARNIKPDDRHILLATASVQEKAGKISRAESTYKAVLNLNKDDQYALLLLGLFYERQGRLDDAIATIETLLKLNPADSEKVKLGLEKLKEKKAKDEPPSKNQPAKKPDA